jgi:hypothetical protein
MFRVLFQGRLVWDNWLELGQPCHSPAGMPLLAQPRGFSQSRLSQAFRQFAGPILKGN